MNLIFDWEVALGFMFFQNGYIKAHDRRFFIESVFAL